MENYIINCGVDKIEQCSKQVEALGYAPGYYKRGGDALKIYSEEDRKRYCVGYYDKYASYIKYNESYKDFVLTSWEEFQKLSSIRQISTKPIIEEAPVFGRNPLRPSLADVMAELQADNCDVGNKKETLVIYAESVVKYYKNAPADHQSLLRALFGYELFKEKSYKVGMEFMHFSDRYKLIATNSKGVSMIDTKTWKPFTAVIKQVADVDNVTEQEMETWLTYHWGNFKLIEG